MEDRITPGLYLEMTETPIATYVAERVPQVLARTDAQRATWWDNVHRDRDDLPRTLPEFQHLVVYEVDDGFRPPAPAPDATGHHFRHYPRPGQGRLTGKPTIGLSLVLISPREPTDAQALRDWGDFVHLRHIAEAAVPGYTVITPYENVTGGDPRFMHFYEMDTDDPEAAYRAMTPLVTERLGAGTPEWDHWAFHPALRIMYVNTFRLLGERRAEARRVTDPDFFAVVHAQRACREFSDAPVTDDEIARILDATVRAPSAENKQPWEFVVVRDRDRREAIGALMERAWNSGGRAFSHDRLPAAMLAEVERGATGGVAAAPVHVVVGADTRRGLEVAAAESIYPAVQNLLLAAGALGLGAALTTIALGYADELRALVAFPDHVKPMAVIPVGHPARLLGASRRDPFALHTHREQFGARWDQGTVGSA